jgi:peptidyl-prolyl cis-trans isomerase SurA
MGHPNRFVYNMASAVALLLGLWMGWATAPTAQAQVLDEIVAVVGEAVILRSDIDLQYQLMLANGEKDDGSLWCELLESQVTGKMLLAKAHLDSLTVSEAQIESELNRRINLMISRLGSVEALEEINKKSLLQLKVELRSKIQDQLLIEREKQRIYGQISVTPGEVKAFFDQIPVDSLPLLPAEVKLSMIQFTPTANETRKQETVAELNKLRGQILDGTITFEKAAGMNSDDTYSAQNGGLLGEFGRGEMVPEFEEVAFNLEVGEISEVFESPFGFHFIRLNGRKGERINASHILIRPWVGNNDEKAAEQRLAEIRQLILSDSLTFAQAAQKYSSDKQTGRSGGMLQDPQSGDYYLPVDQLGSISSDLFLAMDKLKVGEVSEPLPFIREENGRLVKTYHLLLLHDRKPPHIANLRDDYTKLQQAALQSKQAEALDEWFDKARRQVFIELKSDACAQALQHWYK